MRVLYLHSDLEGGGIERQLQMLARHVVAEARAICYRPTNHPRPSPKQLAELAGNGVELFELAAPIPSWRYLLQVARVVRHFGPDILVAMGGILGITAPIVRRLAPVPVVVYREGTEHRSHHPWIRLAREVTAGGLDWTICNCEALRQELTSRLLLRRHVTRMSVIHNGIDLQAFERPVSEGERRRLRAELAGPLADRPIIGSVGVMDGPRKGYDLCLQALPGIMQHAGPLTLVLVGRGAYQETLRRQAEGLGIDAHLALPGWRSDVPALLQAFDVYVQPSIAAEGFPSALIEASAAGLPIVASALSGIPELVEDGLTGLLVRPGDAGALGDALVQLISDRDRAQQLGQAARRRALERFSVQAMAAGYHALFAQLLALKSRAVRAVHGGEETSVRGTTKGS